MLVHLPGSRLARQAFLADRPWAKAGAQVGTVRPTMSPFSTGSEAPNLTVWPEVGAEHVDRALAAQVVARRVGAGTRRRIARRASGGVPKKPLKKERWLLVGWARVSVQDLTLPSRGTRNGRLVLVGADLEAGDAADRLAGRLGAGGVGRRRGLAEDDRRAASVVAAPAPPTRGDEPASQRRQTISSRRRHDAALAKTSTCTCSSRRVTCTARQISHRDGRSGYSR